MAAALSLGCAARLPRASTPDQSPAFSGRRAPGVVSTQTPTYPRAARAASSNERLLWLRAPAATHLAENAVRDFLRATVAEAPERWEPLLSPQASVDTGAGRQPARSFWMTRINALDYTELKGQMLFRASDLQTFRAEDLARLPPGRRMPIELGEDEIAVRVAIRVSWTGRTRLFGDELIFRLQPVGPRFEIVQIWEDFRLP